MSTRMITFAGSTLAIDYQGDRPARIIEFLYRHFPAGSPAEPQVRYRLFPRPGSNQLCLYCQERLLRQSDQEADIADILLGNSCYQLAYHSRGGLLFHAGGLAWREKGLLLPGTMGAGKSTLTAWLLNRGDFDYLTDEMVYLPHQTNRLEGLARPLNLKRSARGVVGSWFDYERAIDQFYQAATTDLIPPGRFKAGYQSRRPRLSLIVFPRYRAGREFKLEALSKARAGLALMECLINARNLPEHGFSEISRLTRVAPAYRLTYSAFDQIGPTIEKILSTLS